MFLTSGIGCEWVSVGSAFETWTAGGTAAAGAMLVFTSVSLGRQHIMAHITIAPNDYFTRILIKQPQCAQYLLYSQVLTYQVAHRGFSQQQGRC